METTWLFVKQIVPLLAGGVLIAGFLLGCPGYEALIPEHYIHDLVGGNSLWANFFAALAGAFMYFETLTEKPILQGLIGSGMGQGPALSLLPGGAGFIPAQHDCPCGDHGGQKDLHVLHDCGGAGHNNRHRLRLALLAGVAERGEYVQEDPLCHRL